MMFTREIRMFRISKVYTKRKWEMQLFGLVRTGAQREAIQFLQKTRKMSRTEATKRVAKVAADLGLGR